MAVYCEFFNLIIPIANIERAFPGGFESFLAEKSEFLDKLYWHDSHLFRDGAMDYDYIKWKVNKYESLGLVGNVANEWIDFCLVVTGDKQCPNCSWLSIGKDSRYAFLKESIADDLILPNKREGLTKYRLRRL